MVTTCWLLIVAGAWYKPLPKLPTGGDNDQVTFGLVVPLSEALNCIDWMADRAAEEGTTAMDTVGISVMSVVATFVGSDALSAPTVTVCWSAINAGAV
jgi:hypothetical protein